MPTIRQLPPSVVNKIAAGEVIERPASVVKELVENSLDAGASRVDVTVEEGGISLIRVADDGCGIAADQLTLALASHATSKINSADDLFRVSTLGFRGEALASIASVSRLLLRSRTADADAATEFEVVGGEAEAIRPASGPCGTTVEVRRLFYNTPVRQKFLRTVQTEMGHVGEAVSRLALAHPHVHFTLAHGGRTIHDLPAGDERDRIAAILGAELIPGLISIDSRDGELALFGYVANPSHSRPNNRLQYLFLNGRFIRDRSLQHALGEAYRGLLLTGRYPICVLHLAMPPAEVDVNVHPTKLEVRFQDGGRVYSQLLGTLRSRFLSTDLIARAVVPTESDRAAAVSGATEGESHLYEWAQRQLTVPASDGASRSFDLSEPFGARRDELQMHRVEALPPSGRQASALPRSTTPQQLEEAPAPAVRSSHAPRALQIHNRYLVVETEVGLEVIDQHALHERIIYETLRERLADGAVESQRLLVPEPVDLPGAEAAAAIENRDVLAQLGLEVEPFGGETVLISAYPAMLANFSPGEVLRDLVEQLSHPGKRVETRDVLDELLHMIACKAAVKFGDRLTPDEIDALLEHRNLAQDHHHCPHGRPTALVFTRDQLDRQFKRI